MFNEFGNPNTDIEDEVSKTIDKACKNLIAFYPGASIVEMRALEQYVLNSVINTFAEARLRKQMKIKKKEKENG